MLLGRRLFCDAGQLRVPFDLDKYVLLVNEIIKRNFHKMEEEEKELIHIKVKFTATEKLMRRGTIKKDIVVVELRPGIRSSFCSIFMS